MGRSNESRVLGSVYVPDRWAEIFCQIISEMGEC